MRVFGEDPSPFLVALGIGLGDFLDPSLPAVLDRGHMARINHEVFFFATPERRDAFQTDPLGACGVLRDPVSLVRFRPAADAPRAEHGGQLYCFSADSTLALFRADPDSFAVPRYGMLSPEAVARASFEPE